MKNARSRSRAALSSNAVVVGPSSAAVGVVELERGALVSVETADWAGLGTGEERYGRRSWTVWPDASMVLRSAAASFMYLASAMPAGVSRLNSSGTRSKSKPWAAASGSSKTRLLCGEGKQGSQQKVRLDTVRWTAAKGDVGWDR